MKRRIPALGWGLCVLALVLLGLGSWFEGNRRAGSEQSLVEHVGLLVGFASFPVLGALIAQRRPRNALGWLFLGIGLCIGLLLAATQYAYLAFVEGWDLPVPTFALWLEQWLWYPALGLITPFALLLFPDGRPAGPFWRLVAWVSGISLVVIVLGSAFVETFEGQAGYRVRNPIGIGLSEVEQSLGPLFAVFGACALLGAVSLVFRFWGSRGDERQQLKLLTVAAVFVVTMSALGDLLELPEIIFPLILWMIPGAIAVAIFKHRLYDIDAVINRTLVYGVLTGILVLAYLGIVFVLQELLTGVTEESDLAVAGSTLAVAALFRPLRSRVQAFIDRRFYRKRYDARQTLESFSSRLRDDVDLDHLAQDLSRVVRDTMQPAHVSVWLRGSEGVRS